MQTRLFEEVRFKVETALRLMPRMTIGALQSFITSRTSGTLREAVLKQLEDEGIIRTFNQNVVSFKGYTSTVRMIERIDEKSAVEITKRAATITTTVQKVDAE
jgi:hypothetical protein